jgi:hypothetical protein
VSFDVPGTYSVSETVTDSSSSSADSNNAVITVTPALEISSFTSNTALISAGQAVGFFNTTTGGTGTNVYSYTVAPGAYTSTVTGSYTESGNTFTFTVPGNYIVSLEVTDFSGETSQSSQVITVTPSPLEVTFFNTTTNSISAGQSVTFANTVTGGTGGYTYTYFINGVPPKSQPLNNQFTFPIPGQDTVVLQVKDSSGDTQDSLPIIVNVSAVLQITSFTSITATSISAGQSVTFANTVIGGTGSNVYTYFVNSIAQASIDNQLQFDTPGTYYVSLGVSDKSGEVANTVETQIVVNVSAPLQVTSFANTTPANIIAGNSVTFANTTSGGTGGNVYAYIVAPGAYTSTVTGSYTESGNTFTFTVPGNYIVSLSVADASGELAASNTITVDAST